MKSLPGFSVSAVLLLLILHIPLRAEKFEVDTIMYHGNIDKRINIVYMGDGYTASEQDKYITDVISANSFMFNFTPYSNYSTYFNVFAVRVISNESGAKHPNTASDCPTGSEYMPTMDPDNYFGSTFDFGGTHRLLYITNMSRYNRTLADNFPQYDQVIVLVNTPYCGGGGGELAVASTHSSSARLVLHELGHSFAGLGDEYDYGTCRDGEGPNYTQETDRGSIKWRAWIEDETPIPTPKGEYCDKIGLYEGAHYCKTGSYRPKCDCIMRSLDNPFCEVCAEHIIKTIHNRVQMIESISPTPGPLKLCDSLYDITFSAEIVFNTPNTIDAQWYLDDDTVASGVSSVTIATDTLSPGIHRLLLEVREKTELMKRYSFGSLVEWAFRTGTMTPVSFSELPDFCENDPPYLLTEGVPAGGSYVSDNVIDNEFHPGLSGSGTHSIDYIYEDIAGCHYSASQTVTVNPVFDSVRAIKICGCDSIMLGGEFRTESGIYYDSLQTVCGCDSVIITELTVHPVHMENRTAEICEGESILLGGEPRSEAGTYYDYYKSIYGCDSIIATQLVVNPLPEVYLGSDTVITPQDTLVLDAGEGFTYYLWSDGSGEQTLILYNLPAGIYDYYIVVKNQFYCMGSDTVRIIVESPGSVQGSWFGPDLEIFPNPASNHLVLRSSTGIPQKMKITLVDNRGRAILEKEIRELRADDEIWLDLSDYKEGIYYLLINNRNLLTIRKLIKNK